MLRIGTAFMAALLISPITTGQETDIEIGTWDVTYSRDGQQSAVMLSVARNSDGKLVGLWSEGEDWITLASVQFENGKLLLKKPVLIDGERVSQSIEATLDGQSISGTWNSAAGLVALQGMKRVKYKQTRFGRGRGRGDGEEGSGGRGSFNIGAMIKEADTNGDGKLQKDEAPEQMKQFFDLMDSDGDGSVTEEEAEEALRRFRGNRN